MVKKIYYCRIDGLKLNNEKKHRSGACEILDVWARCDKCKYMIEKED